jgi:putative glutamine amidotransferase
MAKRPVIGIATQTLEAIPGELPPCWIMGQSYVKILRSVGAVPWLIPLLPDDRDTMREIFNRIDGIFLTGGVDVDPTRYGETKEPCCGRTDPPRDDVEIQLIRWAIDSGKPILAVCRGIQVLNVTLGGTLYQDLATQIPTALKHDWFPTRENPARDYLAHHVDSIAGTRVADCLGIAPAMVNSMHHQAIKTLAPGLRASAVAPDGLIEAVEGSDDTFIVGVQWHPEELAQRDPAQHRLFTSFISAC